MNIDPGDEAALAEAIKSANAPLFIQGGGTRSVRAGEGRVLRTGGLSGITLYEPGALTLVARAGTPIAEIEKTLQAENQRLAFEPYFIGPSDRSTIGGVVATNASGPRRIQAGACRDFLLGVRFVDGSGTVIRNGGRVMKNVTGYDLVRLMAGARGTLGVLTEVSLKVLPQVEDSATLVLCGTVGGEAVAAMAAALGSPFEVTGAAHDPGTRVTWIRIEGFSDSVKYRAGRLRDLLGRYGAVDDILDDAGTKDLWAGIRDGAPLGDSAARWRVSVKPSDGPELIEVLDQLAEKQVLMDWGGGLIWVGAPAHALRDVHALLQSEAARLGGHATLVQGAGDVSGLFPTQPEVPEVAALTRGLRSRFDPRGILNPGAMS